jgi:hypothetical protein
MGIAGYVLYCLGFHCLSLHVSAYMAIFKGVGYLFSYASRILLQTTKKEHAWKQQ